MENRDPNAKPSTLSTFFGGFGSGAVSGSLMMGLFIGLYFLASLIPPLGIAFHASMLGSAAFGIVATSLFSGIMAVSRSKSTGESASDVSRPASRHARGLGQTVPVPVIMADRAESPQAGWTDRIGRAGAGNDRISEILANGALGDKTRASAILQAREAASKDSALKI
jgi:hypothetical protein